MDNDIVKELAALNARLDHLNEGNEIWAARIDNVEQVIIECQSAQYDFNQRLDAVQRDSKETHISNGVEMGLLQTRLVTAERRLIEIDTAEIVIGPGEQVPAGMEPDDFLAVRVVEVAIARFELTPDDVAVFWLPAHIGHEQAREIEASFSAVIKRRFRHFVFVRGGVDIQVYRGQSGKTQSGITD